MAELPRQSRADIDLGHLVLIALRELGAGRRAAYRALPEGTPGRLSEPSFMTRSIRDEIGRLSSRAPGEKRVRDALRQLQDDGLVRLHIGHRRLSLWGLTTDGRRRIGEANG